jgi:hypothetical protein
MLGLLCAARGQIKLKRAPPSGWREIDALLHAANATQGASPKVTVDVLVEPV